MNSGSRAGALKEPIRYISISWMQRLAPVILVRPNIIRFDIDFANGPGSDTIPRDKYERRRNLYERISTADQCIFQMSINQSHTREDEERYINGFTKRSCDHKILADTILLTPEMDRARSSNMAAPYKTLYNFGNIEIFELQLLRRNYD